MTAARRVLVTGASGFIGFHSLAPLVQRGYDVVGVYRNRQPPPVPGVRYVQRDLLKVDDARRLVDEVRPDRLLHLAWYVEPGKMISHVDNLAWVAASIGLLDARSVSPSRKAVAPVA
jgi:nucleoside-diphosphate-sugar epimerase